jgi:hypothetical protein
MKATNVKPASRHTHAVQSIPATLAVLAAALGLQACTTVPMAPLVYGSKSIIGVDISTNASPNPAVNLSIGYKRDDIALVPVAVIGKGEIDKNGMEIGKEKLRIIRGSDEEDDGKDAGKKNHDAMSVFGSFEGRGMGGANDKAVQAELMAANYFSTGIAAQKLAKGFGAAAASRQMALCLKQVSDNAASLTDGKDAYQKLGLIACSSGEKPAAK